MALLWLFELQTSVSPSEKIRGALKWGLHATRALCYALAYAKRMAWVEVINDAPWLLLVLMLEADVQLAERRLLTGPIAWISTVTKGILYVLLFAAAVAWTIESGFQDFVDAVLWLAAFVFIDLNSRKIGFRQQPANRTFSCELHSLR